MNGERLGLAFNTRLTADRALAEINIAVGQNLEIVCILHRLALESYNEGFRAGQKLRRQEHND
jgi:hypothetical protein